MKAKTYNTIFFILGLLTLLYMVYKIGLQVIWNNIVQTGIWFVPVIGIWLIIYILNALAFKEIIFERKLPESNLPFLSILKLTISGYAINYITPFIALGGEPYRVMTLQKNSIPIKQHHRYCCIISSIFFLILFFGWFLLFVSSLF